MEVGFWKVARLCCTATIHQTRVLIKRHLSHVLLWMLVGQVLTTVRVPWQGVKGCHPGESNWHECHYLVDNQPIDTWYVILIFLTKVHILEKCCCAGSSDCCSVTVFVLHSPPVMTQILQLIRKVIMVFCCLINQLFVSGMIVLLTESPWSQFTLPFTHWVMQKWDILLWRHAPLCLSWDVYHHDEMRPRHEWTFILGAYCIMSPLVTEHLSTFAALFSW